MAADLNTLVSHVIEDFEGSTSFSNGLFVITTATDHKNNLNRSIIKKTFSRTLRVETIANSAGGTAAVAMVAQPSTGFLNGHFYADGSPTEDTEDCLGRITVGLTRSRSLTIVVSPLDMIGLIGMAQVLATLAYGIKGFFCLFFGLFYFYFLCETQIWLGDLRLALAFLVCVLFVLAVMICQASCDHRRPCRSFLTNSFVSCKDRALERDRPYRREKKWNQRFTEGHLDVGLALLP